MPKQPPRRHEHDPDRDRRRFENDKGNASHIEIEERRFRGGLTPSPELYALAREQWNKLSGSVVRSPMNHPVPGRSPPVAEAKPESPAQSEGDEPQEDLE